MATTKENALALLPHLVYLAQQREVTTYGKIMSKIGMPAILGGRTLGVIRDEYVLPRNLPMITVLVTNKAKSLPGAEFLPNGTDHLSPQQYKAAFEKDRDAVFNYQGWDDFLRELGLTPLTKPAEARD